MTINTLYELVRNSVEKFASKVAFSMFEGDDVTYAEVGRRIEKVQEILTGAGLRAGDKVALLSSNMPNWGVCYFAVTSAGMVAVPILPDFSGEELDMIIAHSEAKALLVSDRLFTKLSKQTIERLNVVVRTKNLGVIAQRVRGEGTMAVPKPDDLAVIIYTSGTTSKPKGVMLTHAALCAQVGISSGIFPVLPDDVFLSVLPLSHTYECSIGMIYPFSMGARVVYLDRPPTASALMPALRAVRPSVMLIVPLIIEKIYRHQVLAKFNSNGFWRTLYKVGFLRRYLHRVAGKKLLKLFGGRLRFLGIGGAKLDGGAEKFLLEAKVPYAIGYGLTETAPLLAGAAPSQVRLGSTGPQAPGVQLRLEHINPDTRQGEVVALTPSVMLGYFKNPEATKEVFTDDGWFRTGDLGEFDKDGWLYIKEGGLGGQDRAAQEGDHGFRECQGQPLLADFGGGRGKGRFRKDSDAQDQTVPVQQEQRQRQTAAGTACRKTRNQMTRRPSAEGRLVILRQTCLLPGRRMRRAICRNSGRGGRGCSP